jgi:hypothetical protein
MTLRFSLLLTTSVLWAGGVAAQTSLLDPYRAQTGTTAGTLAAGNDPRIVGALQSSANLGDLTSAAASRVNLGLGDLATQNSQAVNIIGGMVGSMTLGNGGNESFNSTGVRIDVAPLSVANPLLYGYGNSAVGCSVTGNGAGGGLAQVMGGFSQPANLSGYADRDMVGCYIGMYNRPSYLPGVIAAGFGVSSVTLTAPVDTSRLRVNMIVDTSDNPKFSGLITGWSADGTVIDVSGWYQAGNAAANQVPAGMALDINPNTKIWAINANADMYAGGEAKKATGFELGINNRSGADDAANQLWGIDVVNLGGNSVGTGYVARGLMTNAFVAGDGNGGVGSNAGFLYNPGNVGFGAALMSYAPAGPLFDAWTSSRGHTLMGDVATGAVDLGAFGLGGVVTSPALRFHTTGGSNAQDAAIAPSGGAAGTNGAATLTYTAADHVFSMNATQQMSLAPNGAGAVAVSASAGQSLVLIPGSGGGVVAANGGVVVNAPQFELGAPTAPVGTAPYLDWHYGTGQAQDYNVRISNDGDGQLTIRNAAGMIGQFSSQGLLVPDLRLANIKPAGSVFAGPPTASGVAGFRSLVASDMPASVLVDGPRSIAIRATYPLRPASSGLKTAATYRQYYQAAARAPIVSVKLRYANTGAAGGVTEGDGANGLTIAAAIEVNPNSVGGPWALGSAGAVLYPMTFNNGQHAAAITSGGQADSDDLYIPLGMSQSFYIRTFVTAPNGGTWPGSQGINPALFEAVNDGSFNVAVATTNGVQSSFSGTISGADVVLPLQPGSLRFYGANISPLIADDGSGRLAGNAGATGTINYATGAYALQFAAAPTAGSLAAVGISRSGSVAADETMVLAPADMSQNFLLWSAFTPSFAPSLVLGRTAPAGIPQRAVCVVGDSIVAAAGNLDELVAYPDYAVAQQMGIVRVAQPGETAAAFRAQNYRRLAIMGRGCDRLLGDYATNDALSGRSLPEIENDLLAIWSQAAAGLPHGFLDITWQTMLPRTNSPSDSTPFLGRTVTWGGATVASGSPSLRNAYNAWLCTQVGVTIGAVLDLNALVENSPASCSGSGDGAWKSAAMTWDGTHLSETVQRSMIPASVGAQGVSPAPVFTP